MEWEYFPEICLLTAWALKHAKTLFAGLIVKPKGMEQNLHREGGLIVAEAVMMQLAKAIGRQKAHEVVYAACMAAHEQRRPLKETLLADTFVRSHLTPDELDALLDPKQYLGLSGTFVDRVLAHATLARTRETAGGTP